MSLETNKIKAKHPVNPQVKTDERSFTLFEAIIALLILSTVMVHLTGLQGNIIYFSEYGTNSAKGMLLAKRVMSQVEYHAHRKPFTEMKYESLSEIPFEDEPTFTYKLSVKDWKLPILDFFAGGGAENGEDGESEDGESETPAPGAAGAAGGGMADAVKQALGDELLKVAKVEVFWPEGAKKDSVTLSYLLANTQKIDENIGALESDYKQLLNEVRTGKSTTTAPPKNPASGATPNPADRKPKTEETDP